MESAEIHSMSMEFFTWPWMKGFFKEDTERFKYKHIVGSLSFLPYGACVDHFQHWVYENPRATPEERKDKWSLLESTYLPGRDYDNLEYPKSGGIWQGQLHIYQMPFYYIDYMMEIDDDQKEPGTIVQEIQKGFMMKDRLLRPALVGVSKKTKIDGEKSMENKEN